MGDVNDGLKKLGFGSQLQMVVETIGCNCLALAARDVIVLYQVADFVASVATSHEDRTSMPFFGLWILVWVLSRSSLRLVSDSTKKLAVSTNDNGIKILANADGMRLLRTVESRSIDASRFGSPAVVKVK
ncbi:hypothetical protein Vadar_017405 [Vaccinium darrowii]|uniref:Uncharacterized protein n=1 Tax=Vaccinium darrowii TaxID=229202 RepID=A0ACB7Z4P8_9ERIC|nr:hypothetical protein Vadar_017405 [Vaccinium darrowii]